MRLAVKSWLSKPISLANVVTRELWSRRSLKPSWTHLDIGSGHERPRDIFGSTSLYGIDVLTPTGETNEWVYVQGNLKEPLPFESNSFDSISAWDVLEHIPRQENEGFPFIQLMQEVHRTLRPGGLFIALTPAFPRPEAFQDPTHINFITKKTAEYFSSNDGIAKRLGYWTNEGYTILANDWFPRVEDLFRSGKTNPNFCVRVLLGYAVQLKLVRPSHILWVFEKPKQD